MSENIEEVKKEKKNSGKVGRIIKNIIAYLILIVCLFALSYSGYVLFNYLKTNKASNDTIKNINNTVKVEPNSDLENIGATFGIDFEKLESMNSDVVGWITIKGTAIDYAILQSYDNDFYLRRSIDKNYSWFGWPFMDYRNSGDFTDRNTIIYGHNIKTGLMFADLQDLQAGKYGDSVDIYIYTKDKNRVYKVFSTYIVDPESYYLTTNFADDEAYNNFLNTLKERSTINFNVAVGAPDRILTLSTCTSDSTRRIVVHAKLYLEEDKK
ncbi:MAG: class B sortase [Clostridia bacterium]|nr:class B sortase [Clostridia bacterium]